MLEGSVRKSGNRVRITAQLIDATTGGHLWAERFDRDLTDIFAVQDDVTQHIVGALALNLTRAISSGSRPSKPTTSKPMTAFCVAESCCGGSPESKTSEARDLLQRAIDLDPNFASAHAFLA